MRSPPSSVSRAALSRVSPRVTIQWVNSGPGEHRLRLRDFEHFRRRRKVIERRREDGVGFGGAGGRGARDMRVGAGPDDLTDGPIRNDIGAAQPSSHAIHLA